MSTVILDLAHIETVRALHVYLAYKLNLPAHYGKNLDALHDLLTENSEETRIILRTAGVTGENAAYLHKLVRVMEDAAQENAALTVEVQ